jgi:hypothetical protein
MTKCEPIMDLRPPQLNAQWAPGGRGGLGFRPQVTSEIAT